MPPGTRQIRPPGRSIPYTPNTIADFRGGLVRTRDFAELEPNQVINISNFDLDRGGGLKTRPGTKRAVLNLTTETGAVQTGRALANMGYYGDSQGGEKILLSKGENAAAVIWCPTSGTARTLTGINAAHFYRLAGYTVILAHEAATPTAVYIDDGDILNATATTMTELYEDDYETPTTVGHPPARYGCVQHYRAWIVDESLVNRVRFSHPNDPRYWHSDDWIDVGPKSSDITGLYALGSVVLCVKQDSVWYIQGDVLAAMRLRKLDQPIAADFSDAFEVRTSCEGQGRVWIWTKADGLVSINGNLEPSFHAEKLRRFGDVPGVASISYADGKVFCWSDEFDITYVYDPAIDGWTTYSYEMSEFTNITLGTYSAQGDTVTLFLDEGAIDGSGHNYVMVMDEQLTTDSRGATPTVSAIPASVTTSFQWGQGPTEPDKWGRPRVLLETEDGVDLSGTILVYKNLEDTTAVATTNWTLDYSEEGYVKNVRGPSAGSAESVAYRVTTAGERVYLHAIVPRFRPKRIRR